MISPESFALLRTGRPGIAPPWSYCLHGATKLLKHTQLITSSTKLPSLRSANRDTLIIAQSDSERKDGISCSLETMYVYLDCHTKILKRPLANLGLKC